MILKTFLEFLLQCNGFIRLTPLLMLYLTIGKIYVFKTKNNFFIHMTSDVI